MREIKFRGKRVNNGDWVDGDVLISDTKSFIIPKMDQYDWNDSCVFIVYEVLPETVGQYTGLPDKKGKEIFESDILHISIYGQYEKPIAEGNNEVIFKDCKFGVLWRNDWHVTPLSGFCNTTFEVIGNIHDNPELMEATDEQ